MQLIERSGYRGAILITPSNSTLLNLRAIFVGVGGDIAIKYNSTASSTIFKNVPSGSILPIELESGIVMATGTTATDLIALY